MASNSGGNIQSRIGLLTYYHEAKLVIEVDGRIHLNKQQKENDQGRTYELEGLGLRVIRFSNEEVQSDIGSV